MKDKFIKLSRAIFGYGMASLVLICFLVAVAYIIGFILGLPASAAISAFCTGSLLPIVYKASILLCILGIINMYARGLLIFRLETHAASDATAPSSDNNKS